MKEKRQNRKLAIWIAVLALVAVVTVGTVKESLAYFTTYNNAIGSYVIHYGELDTRLDETIAGRQKDIRIKNAGSELCYVRAKVFYGGAVSLTYSGSGKWSEASDGYWYYSDPISPEEETESLIVDISYPEDYAEDFNVIVVQEGTAVLYDANGNPYADWNLVISEEVTA